MEQIRKVKKTKLFLDNKNIILSSRIKKTIKQDLLDINKKTYELLNAGYNIPNIILDNFSKDEVRLYNNKIIDIATSYLPNLDIINYDLSFHIEGLKNNESKLLIIDNYDDFIKFFYNRWNIDKAIYYIKNKSLTTKKINDIIDDNKKLVANLTDLDYIIGKEVDKLYNK